MYYLGGWDAGGGVGGLYHEEVSGGMLLTESGHLYKPLPITFWYIRSNWIDGIGKGIRDEGFSSIMF
ncbi:predicted protein [Sclerotinia sclerotiorum 1980 UF-70]|uniref:Uncharacterized protein n=1 Tax=Sclerotinia sclerotiorum (strain ATCC 18683 / 1980 / Ss-1) TaxID=665079 RepID=A7F9Y9_SCLS1|nr:predicted protein [Sclerotinia sclerotiorum 1980 UF-70]EDO00550.1 predicted protein [Sclerotinia sclerotiorum 1980 UF-70]